MISYSRLGDCNPVYIVFQGQPLYYYYFLLFIFVCVWEYRHEFMYVCGSQKTTLVVRAHFVWAIFYCVCQVSWPVFSRLCPQPHIGHWNYKVHTAIEFSMHSGDSNSHPLTCTSRTLPREASTQSSLSSFLTRAQDAMVYVCLKPCWTEHINLTSLHACKHHCKTAPAHHALHSHPYSVQV